MPFKGIVKILYKNQCIYLYIQTPTNRLAKKLNELIKTYIPSKYWLSNINDFIGILRSTRPDGPIASIDVKLIHECSSRNNNRNN